VNKKDEQTEIEVAIGDNLYPDLNKLKDASKRARDLASECFRTDTTGACWNLRNLVNTPPKSCFQREQVRLKGYPILPDKSTMRSYSMFNPERLCSSCLAYWHIEMGAQALQHLSVVEQECAAEREQKAKEGK
jgi:hypothetical protein